MAANNQALARRRDLKRRQTQFLDAERVVWYIYNLYVQCLHPGTDIVLQDQDLRLSRPQFYLTVPPSNSTEQEYIILEWMQDLDLYI